MAIPGRWVVVSAEVVRPYFSTSASRRAVKVDAYGSAGPPRGGRRLGDRGRAGIKGGGSADGDEVNGLQAEVVERGRFGLEDRPRRPGGTRRELARRRTWTLKHTQYRGDEALRASCVIYDFRNTFATRVIERGVPVALVEAILGHSNLRTIYRYVHPSADA
jgi:hypothetical protein